MLASSGTLMPPLGASVPPQGAVMVLNRWLLERDWCPL